MVVYCVCSVLGLFTWNLNACCYSSTNNQICQTCTYHTHQIALLTRWDQPGSAQPGAGQLNSTDLQDHDLHPTASPVTHRKTVHIVMVMSSPHVLTGSCAIITDLSNYSYLFKLYTHCCIVPLLYASNILIWITATSVNFLCWRFQGG